MTHRTGEAHTGAGHRPSDAATRLARSWVARVVPTDLLGRIRLSLLGAALLTAAATVVIVGTSRGAWELRLAALGALLWLGWRWVRGYRRGDLTRRWDLVEGIAVLLIGAAAGGPIKALGIFYQGLFLRSLYGSLRRALVGACMYLAAFLGALAWSAPDQLVAELVLQHVLGFLLTTVMMHLVARTGASHQRGAAREAVLSRVGAELVGARSREDVHRAAVEAALGLAGADPTTSAVVAEVSSTEMVVVAAAGPGASEALGARVELRRLPGELRRSLQEGRPLRAEEARELGEAFGFPAGAHATAAPIVVAEELVGLVMTAQESRIREGCAALGTLSAEVALALEGLALAEGWRRSEARFRSLVQNSSDVVMVLDAEGVVRYISPSVERVLGHVPEKVLGTPGVALIHPDGRQRVQQLRQGLLRSPGAQARAEVRMAHADGSWRLVEGIATNLFEDPAVAGVVINLRDITERRALEDELTHQAFHDTLTGLANRALFLDRMEHAWARTQRYPAPLAVLFIDLDDFKAINDTLGHAAGDEVLVAVAERLRECLRGTDTIARLGGDEFAVLLEYVDENETQSLAKRILSTFDAPLTLRGTPTFLGASIGIALSALAQTADELLRNADLAMYMAKGRGKGRAEVFEPALRERLAERAQLEADLRGAVERGEFVLHYQPIVELETGRPAGAEALVRWAHPTRGFIQPGEFIPLAEETGLIVPLGKWVLEEACRQAQAWQAAHPSDPPFGMSVNVSARQLHPGLVEDVARALAEFHLAPGSLTLEITESALVQEAGASVGVFEDLKALGVRIALDDFGTGYSSLSYLARFPIDVVKIDRSFIEGLDKGPEESALARGIIRLSKSLGLEVVAEGIERAEQLGRLQVLRCRLGQGYYFSKPVPKDQIDLLLSGGADSSARVLSSSG